MEDVLYIVRIRPQFLGAIASFSKVDPAQTVSHKWIPKAPRMTSTMTTYSTSKHLSIQGSNSSIVPSA